MVAGTDASLAAVLHSRSAHRASSAPHCARLPAVQQRRLQLLNKIQHFGAQRVVQKVLAVCPLSAQHLLLILDLLLRLVLVDVTC